jgi:hypothetical protein
LDSTFPSFTPDNSGNAHYGDTLPPNTRGAYRAALNYCSDKAEKQSNTEFGVPEANRRFAATDAKVQQDSSYLDAVHDWQSCAALFSDLRLL